MYQLNLLIIFNIKHHSRKLPMYSRTTQQASYSRSTHQETDQMPLRSRAFSHIDNITHLTSNQPSFNANTTDDKVSEIKKKYERVLQSNKKAHGEVLTSSTIPMNVNKSVSAYDAYDENSRWSPYKQTYHNESTQLQRNNYGKPPIKSELENNRVAISAMKTQLQSKLNDLTAKAQANSSLYMKDQPRGVRKEAGEDNTYQMILSKYSKNPDYRLGNDRTKVDSYSRQRPEYERKVLEQKPQDISTSYLDKYTTNKNSLFDNEKPQAKHQLSIITETNSNHSDAQKETSFDNKQKQAQAPQAYKRTADRTGESAIINDRKYIYEKNYNEQRTTSSYIYDKNKGEQKTNLEFTLQKQEKPEASPSFRPHEPSSTPNKYEYNRFDNPTQTTTTLKYEANTSKLNNPAKDQNIEKNFQTPKPEPRNSQAISREIQKLDLKIKQIEQNKKALNINFSPYSASKGGRTSITPQQYPKGQISRNEKAELSAKYSMNPTPPSASNHYDRTKHNISIRHQDIPKPSPAYSRKLFAQTIKNEQKHLSIPFTPAESNNDDEELTERSTADPNFQSRMNNYAGRIEAEKRNDYGIDERKRQMQSRVEINNTIKGLVKALGDQVALDETFRNNKIWFASEQQDKKWVILKNELQNIGVSISETMLKETFTLDESQNNPFFSVSDAKCTIQSLAQSYQQAQNHWDQKIARKFSKMELQREGFNSSRIDYDRKGFIEVEDLVRFLNIESGTFFRIRDLSIIFKRIGKSSQLQFSELLESVSA